MEESTTQVNKNHYPIHSMWGHYFIVLDPSVHPSSDQWFTEERQPNGDIYLIKKRDSRPQLSQEADDHTEGYYAFTNLDPDVVGELKLQEGEMFTHGVLDGGIFLRRKWKGQSQQ